MAIMTMAEMQAEPFPALSQHQLHDSYSSAFYLASGLLTIITGSTLCSITDTQHTSFGDHAFLKLMWALCASIFVLISLDAKHTPTGLSYLTPTCLVIGIAMLWLVVNILRFIISCVIDPDLLAAKVTILWKLFHVKRGTYGIAVRDLHEKYGGLIQVGPYEFSLSNPAYFERCVKFEKVGCTRPSLKLLC